MGLADETPDASAWLDSTVASYRGTGRFNELKSAVIWSGALGDDGKPIIDIDPDAQVAAINEEGQPLLLGHDPGHPLGKVLVARKFTSPNGQQFIAAVLGIYAGQRKSFAEMGITTDTEYSSPDCVPYFDTMKSINLSIDPREFPEDWLRDTIENSPFPIRAMRASNNELISPHELIRIGVLFVTLVWNPFVTAIGSEAGKDVYKAIRLALSRLVKKAADLRNPIVEIQTFHDGCEISFILRRDGAQAGYAAMNKLSGAATQAEHLIFNFRKAGNDPSVVVYEYDPRFERWYPSFAEMKDGTFVTDNEKLIVVEKLPNSLSMGLVSIRDRPSE